MDWCNQGIGGDKIITLQKIVRIKKHKNKEKRCENYKTKSVLGSVVIYKSNLVSIANQTKRVVRASRVKVKDMHETNCSQNKGQEKMKSKKTRQSSVVNCKTTPNPRHKIMAKVGQGTKQIGNDRSPPKSYLASR